MLEMLRSLSGVWALCCVASAVGCTADPAARTALPDRFVLARHQLLIHSDFPLPEHHRLVEELCVQRADMSHRLGLPASDEPIHVYVFETAERFEEFLRYRHPDFPRRRAFFVETDNRLIVYAQWGDKVGDDLRHEVAHAYLHSAVPHIPLWLDEGLAEYYECHPARRGLNHVQLERLAELLRSGWQPDLVRLEALIPPQQMNRDQYAEAWAWVYFLLHSEPAHLDLVRRYLTDLREGGNRGPLSARIKQACPDAEAVLVRFLADLIDELTVKKSTSLRGKPARHRWPGIECCPGRFTASSRSLAFGRRRNSCS